MSVFFAFEQAHAGKVKKVEQTPAEIKKENEELELNEYQKKFSDLFFTVFEIHEKYSTNTEPYKQSIIDFLNEQKNDIITIKPKQTSDSIASIKSGSMTPTFIVNVFIINFYEKKYKSFQTDNDIVDTNVVYKFYIPAKKCSIGDWKPFPEHTCAHFQGLISKNTVYALQEKENKIIEGQIKKDSVIFNLKTSEKESDDQSEDFVQVTFQPGCKVCKEDQELSEDVH